ncbi:hypothetical protein DRN76_00245 [Methanosarcinales archaeon]|nr:MAG: hypothetical protein DRN76_00245 [Methanosarcinales archaeon]
MKNLLARLNGVSIEPGTLIWDRGNVSRRYVEMVGSMGWKLICGIPKTSKEAKEIISMTNVPIGPDTLLYLELNRDYEEDFEGLFIVIKTNLSPEDSLNLLDRFDEEWWLDVNDDIGNILEIMVRPT